ncbi:signal recognition particle-docking protein FtsY [Alcaligenaceae bacterium LF4-65]|uniref:Signal recognition particle receptor FtsY n=2 Tax=Zwartia hollandica TaxID=324606 RepID=A0A953N7M6_9BURK|nr:signal recognition particle-docking protein FtsY [Zwartia hollandica]MBZ1349629.1 signal recognition particle-docking protein FtsY [Zwartia hollandica]
MFRFFKKKTTPVEPLPEAQTTTPAPDLSISQNTSTEVSPDAAQSPPVQGRRFMLSQALSGAPLGRQTGLPIVSADIAQPSAAVPIVSVDAAQQPEAPAHAPALELVEDQSAEQTEEQIAEQKTSWLAKLKGGLAKTGQSLGSLFVGVRVDEDLFEELETALIMADAGVEATEQLMSALRARVKRDRIEDADAVRQALKDVLADHLKILEKPFDVGHVKPLVVMITGVNGAGKTTSIGKLANALQQRGAKVLLAAGDTFRAAAREQLVEWGNRNNVSVVAQDGGDPAAVAFDSVHAGRARGMDIVMIDTAGRLPTQLHLMDELKKIRRVIAKADPTAPHEVLLVVDGNSGQNVLSQIRSFDAAVGLTGLIVTKLDGTAKGGTLAAVAAGSQGTRPVPVYWIGVGEKMEDLQPFVAADFAAALVG